MELGAVVEGMWEAAITHFILPADPNAAGRPSGTSALFILLMTDPRQLTIVSF